MGIYYASSKLRYDSNMKNAYDAINKEIQSMVTSGEIDNIYKEHGAPIPSH